MASWAVQNSHTVFPATVGRDSASGNTKARANFPNIAARVAPLFLPPRCRLAQAPICVVPPRMLTCSPTQLPLTHGRRTQEAPFRLARPSPRPSASRVLPPAPHPSTLRYGGTPPYADSRCKAVKHSMQRIVPHKGSVLSTARRRHTLRGPCQRCGLAGPPSPPRSLPQSPPPFATAARPLLSTGHLRVT